MNCCCLYKSTTAHRGEVEEWNKEKMAAKYVRTSHGTHDKFEAARFGQHGRRRQPFRGTCCRFRNPWQKEG